MPLTVAELAALLQVTPVGPAEQVAAASNRLLTGVVVDSRLVEAGSLFVALPGERVDGHDYVATAAAAGAVAAITARPVDGAVCLVVPDPQHALGRVARRVVDDARRGGLRVVGLTGSAGKTSTKDLLAQVLETAGPTVAPAGSFNNEIGLPLTACRVQPDTRFLVAEMGARGVGHIAYLCELTPPDVGLELNVGTAHLGEFGSRETIALAKGELVAALPADGTAVLNAADPLVAGMAGRSAAPVLWWSSAPDPGPEVAVQARDWSADDLGRWSFTLVAPDGAAPVTLRTVGRQQVGNAVAAAAVAAALGLPVARVAAALSAATARSRWRMELTERPDGVAVLNDAYNANPDSMRAALDALDTLVAGRRGRYPQARAWAVLGDMLELGPASAAEHTAVGAYARGRGVSRLLAVGQNAQSIVDGARAEGSGGEPGGEGVQVVPDKAAAAELVATGVAPGDVVLVKASRGAGLETVAEALLAPTGVAS